MSEPTPDNFEGHTPRECGEHRTVGPHRAWCFDCTEWCYPSSPCARCELATTHADEHIGEFTHDEVMRIAKQQIKRWQGVLDRLADM